MTEIFAHRGSKGTRPENTLDSFVEAVRVGADGIELDVHLTADRQLVVIHDETVERTTDGSGLVRDSSLSELTALDAGDGARIPSLAQVLSALTSLGFAGTLNIELKTDKFPYPGIEDILLTLTSSAPWPFRIVYSSFNFDSLERLHTLSPAVELCALVKNNPIKIRAALQSPIITALHLRHSYYFARHSHLHKPCRLWTVNTPTAMARAYQLGVAAIITDYPERARLIRQQIATRAT